MKLVTQYKSKLTFLFLLIGVFVLLTPAATGWMIYGVTRDARQIYVYMPDEELAQGINSNVRRYSSTAEKIQSSLNVLRKVIYESQNLQSTLAEEFLESGLAVDNFTVKPIPPANKVKTVPSKGSEDWKFFNFATVSLSGALEVDNIPKFMFFLSTRPKLWHISTLDIQPMDAPADFVTRFQRVEKDITAQGRTFERDNLLKLINERANKNKMSVSLAFLVPITVEVGVQ
jgi:hypothetical protein